jgi:hypothetical protein
MTMTAPNVRLVLPRERAPRWASGVMWINDMAGVGPGAFSGAVRVLIRADDIFLVPADWLLSIQNERDLPPVTGVAEGRLVIFICTSDPLSWEDLLHQWRTPPAYAGWRGWRTGRWRGDADQGADRGPPAC